MSSTKNVVSRRDTTNKEEISSLTPQSRADEVVAAANYEGIFNGMCCLLPSMASTIYLLKNSKKFVMYTNVASRTAITITPACFAYFLTSEQKLSHKMREIAHEKQHAENTVRWADDQWKQKQQQQQVSTVTIHEQQQQLSESQHMHALYTQSIRSKGVNIIPQLQWYHSAGNYVSDHPVRVLLCMAAPAVSYIFYGRGHTSLAINMMHTRVYGQFFTICSLLGIMGFHEYMSSNGRYISQDMADAQFQELNAMRTQLHEHLDQEEQTAKEMQDAMMAVRAERLHKQTIKKKKKEKTNEDVIDVADENIATINETISTNDDIAPRTSTNSIAA